MTAPSGVSGAAVTVQDAIAAALEADAPFAAWLGAAGGDTRVYEVLAPTGTMLRAANGAPWPYVTLSSGDETSLDVLAARGFEERLRVRVWVPGAAERLAKAGAGHVRRILESDALAGLTGYVRLSARVERVSALTDPDGEATQAMCDVNVHARVAA